MRVAAIRPSSRGEVVDAQRRDLPSSGAGLGVEEQGVSNSGSCCPAPSSNRRTSSAVGGVTLGLICRPGVGLSAGLLERQPHFTAWANAKRRTPCTRCTVDAESGFPSFPPR